MDTDLRIEVDEDGARDIFAVARLGKEGLEGAGLPNVGSVGIGATVRLEAVLEKIAMDSLSVCFFDGLIILGKTYSSQAELPSWVPAWPIWMWQT